MIQKNFKMAKTLVKSLVESENERALNMFQYETYAMAYEFGDDDIEVWSEYEGELYSSEELFNIAKVCNMNIYLTTKENSRGLCSPCVRMF